MADDTQTIDTETPKPRPFFSYDPDGDGFQDHETGAEAEHAVAVALDHCRDEAHGDGWPENTERICWGVIRGQVTETYYKERPEEPAVDAPADEREEWEEAIGEFGGFDCIAHHDLVPVPDPGPLDALRALLNRGAAVEEEIPDEGLAAELERWIALGIKEDAATRALQWHEERHGTREEQELEEREAAADIAAQLTLTDEAVRAELIAAGIDPRRWRKDHDEGEAERAALEAERDRLLSDRDQLARENAALRARLPFPEDSRPIVRGEDGRAFPGEVA